MVPAIDPLSDDFAPARLETGVPGLDEVLGAGLVKGSLYLIEGRAGAGKTILSAQIAFHLARQGKRVLFMTLLAESHGKLLDHLRQLSFFDPALFEASFSLISGFGALLEGGFDAFFRLWAGAVDTQRPDLAIIDGFSNLRGFRTTDWAQPRLLQQMSALASATGCTTLLLAPAGEHGIESDRALVDGVIELTTHANGVRKTRELEVHKLRAGAQLQGRHLFRISAEGLHVYPRLEARPSEVASPPGYAGSQTLRTGVAELDVMLAGGLRLGSATSLLGTPGSGKTTLGLTFLEEGLTQGQACLYFGFFESPQRLVFKARNLGIDLQPHLDSGQLKLIWQAPLELMLDELADRLFGDIGQRRVERLVIDGLDGFRDSAMHPDRIPAFAVALLNELKARGVTSMITEEQPLFGEFPERALRMSGLVENIVLLRYVEIRSNVQRLLSILKVRDEHYDTSIRELAITSQGVQVRAPFRMAEQLLTGRARTVVHEATAPPRRRLGGLWPRAGGRR